MLTCVIGLGYEITYSLIYNDKLIISSKVDDLNALSDLLNNQKIDKLKLLFQGVPVSQRTDDSFIISEINVSGNFIPVVVKDSDQMFFAELASLLSIKELEVYSYMDYIESKFAELSDCIIVSRYTEDYALFHLHNGKLDNFTKSSRLNLSKKIARFKNIYKCPVYNNESFVDTTLNDCLSNLSTLDDEEQSAIDYLGFCLTTEGKSLLKEDVNVADIFATTSEEVTNEPEGEDEDDVYNTTTAMYAGGYEKSDLDYYYDDGDDLTYDEDEESLNGSLPTKKNKKEKGTFRFSTDDKESDKGKIKIICNALMAAFIVLSVAGLAITIIFSDTIKEARAQADSLKSTIKDIDNVVNKPEEKKPVSALNYVYSCVKENSSIVTCSVEPNTILVNVESTDENSSKTVESEFCQKYTVDSAQVDTYTNSNGETLYSTKISIDLGE